MIVFHQLVYQGQLISPQSVVHSSIELSPIMGLVDMIHIGGYASQVSGTSPTLNVYQEGSYDGGTWHIETGLGTFALGTAPAETQFQGVSVNTRTAYSSPFRRVLLLLTGTNVLVGRIAVWVTGRDTSRRARNLVASSNG